MPHEATAVSSPRPPYMLLLPLTTDVRRGGRRTAAPRPRGAVFLSSHTQCCLPQRSLAGGRPSTPPTRAPPSRASSPSAPRPSPPPSPRVSASVSQRLPWFARRATEARRSRPRARGARRRAARRRRALAGGRALLRLLLRLRGGAIAEPPVRRGRPRSRWEMEMERWEIESEMERWRWRWRWR